jgi:hypothetical protein
MRQEASQPWRGSQDPISSAYGARRVLNRWTEVLSGRPLGGRPGSSLWTLPFGATDSFAFAALGLKGDRQEQTPSEGFWGETLGDDASRAQDADFLRCFGEGAADVWRKVPDKLEDWGRGNAPRLYWGSSAHRRLTHRDLTATRPGQVLPTPAGSGHATSMQEAACRPGRGQPGETPPAQARGR